MSDPIVEFTPHSFREFIQLRDKALEDGRPSFRFQGQEVLVSYAKYVIEYLRTQGLKPEGEQ